MWYLVFTTCVVGVTVSYAQKTADISIENALVNNGFFSWEIHITPTSDWGSSFSKALGDCSWIIEYNSNALTTPTLTFVASEVDPGAGYTNFVNILGDRVGATTDLNFPAFLGVNLNQGTNYHLYTVTMCIIDSSQQAGIFWDQVNTGIFNAVDEMITVSFWGDGNIPLQSTVSAINDVDDIDLPRHFKLYPNYPNPFNPVTTIRYEIPATGESVQDIRLIIYNSLGMVVYTLYSGRANPGIYEITWNGQDRNGNPVASGIYLLRLQTKEFNQIQKMILIH